MGLGGTSQIVTATPLRIKMASHFVTNLLAEFLPFWSSCKLHTNLREPLCETSISE